MNIRLIHSAIRHGAARVVAIAAAAALTSLGGGLASAQTATAEGLSYGFGSDVQIVPASSVRTAADASGTRLAPGAISHAVGTYESESQGGVVGVGHYGCSSCNQGSCNGSCNSCGPGYGSGGYGGGSMACGVPCNPYCYASVDALYMKRDGDGNFSMTQFVGMGEFDFELSGRVTIGSVPNCMNGWEATWIGPLEWDRYLIVSNDAGTLQTYLFDGDFNSNAPGAFDGTFLDPFQDANQHVHTYSSEYWSAELSRTIIGWDVAKILCGGRIIQIDEDYNFASRKDVFQSTASLSSSTENTLVGLQAGLDLLYPLGRFCYSDLRGRAGIYGNFADSEIGLRNSGTTVLQNSGEDEEIAGVFEFSGGLRWELGEMLAIRANGEFWYITNVATAANQINPAVTNQLGRSVDIGEDVFFYGLTVGAEVRY